MKQRRWIAGALALGLTLVLAGAVRAERVPTSRAAGYRSTGARTDITVPYTTNGYSNFGVAQGVAPKIYKSPIVDNLANPQSKPVFNLIFWGSEQSFGGKSNGATPKPRR